MTFLVRYDTISKLISQYHDTILTFSCHVRCFVEEACRRHGRRSRAVRSPTPPGASARPTGGGGVPAIVTLRPDYDRQADL